MITNLNEFIAASKYFSMPEEKIEANEKGRLEFLCHRTKHTFIFLQPTKSQPEKKMKECFLQRFIRFIANF